MSDLFVVTYRGQFGFIKPWTAVRDSLTYSQQFLTPSIIEGIEKKLFPELSESGEYKFRIVRHKLTYNGINRQQEQVQTRGWREMKRTGRMVREKSVLMRGVMIRPTLKLGFKTMADAEKASKQHLCLCRNEDLVFPYVTIEPMTIDAFDRLDGFELRFERKEGSFIVGYNRYQNNEPMYGWLDMKGILFQQGE